MKRLGTRVNLIPVIAKADTLTQSDLSIFKQRVSIISAFSRRYNVLTNFCQIREVIVAQGIRVYQPPIEADDEQSAELARTLINTMPFSIIGSTEDVKTADGRTVKGREYLWGVAEGLSPNILCFIRC
jgi:cell division control protein 12